MSLHRVQQFILAQLAESDSLRYRDMRPVSMEASQFLYHLRKLICDGLVVKLASGSYALSASGKSYVDRADSDNFDLRPQARLGALIVCRHEDYGYLYVRRDTHPARGQIGFPIIDLPLGFPLPLVSYASDAFSLASGLKLALVHRADGYVNVERGGELEGSLLAHIFSAEPLSGPIDLASGMFDFCWENQLSPSDKKLVLASNEFILKQLEKHKTNFFFFEQTMQLPS